MLVRVAFLPSPSPQMVAIRGCRILALHQQLQRKVYLPQAALSPSILLTQQSAIRAMEVVLLVRAQPMATARAVARAVHQESAGPAATIAGPVHFQELAAAGPMAVLLAELEQLLAARVAGLVGV